MNAFDVSAASIVSRLPERAGVGITFLDAKGAWQSKSFPDIASDVGRLAKDLARSGLGEGSRVALHASNSYEWIVFDLALASLRCVSIAIPEFFDFDTARDTARNLGASAMFTRATGFSEQWIGRLELGSQELKPEASERSAARTEPDLTWAFSSGTTGRPKCLRVDRKGFEAALARFFDVFSVDRADSVILFLPLAAGAQQRMIVYGALHVGARIILCDPLRLFKALKEQRPTVVIAPPIFYEQIAQKVRERRIGRLIDWCSTRWNLLAVPRFLEAIGRRLAPGLHEALGGRVRLALTGMAPMRLATIRCLRLLGLPLFEVYGLSESGVVSANRPGCERIGSVGRPLVPGSAVIGESGEVLIELERGMSSGYVSSDPEESRRVYREDGRLGTGDVGFVDSQGFLHLKGRQKNVVVTSGGEKLHPEEIESEICDRIEVSSCVVLPLADSNGVAVVVVPSEAITPETATRRVSSLVATKLGKSVPFKIVVSDQPFSIQNGLLTRSLKYDRGAAAKRFSAAIAKAKVHQ